VVYRRGTESRDAEAADFFGSGSATKKVFYFRTSSLRHKIKQDNFGSGSVGSDWESSRFRITDRQNVKTNRCHKKQVPNYTEACNEWEGGGTLSSCLLNINCSTLRRLILTKLG